MNPGWAACTKFANLVRLVLNSGLVYMFKVQLILSLIHFFDKLFCVWERIDAFLKL